MAFARILATFLLAGLALSAAQGQHLSKTQIVQLPPFTAAYAPQGVDEKGLWSGLDEEERKFRDSQFVIADPELKAYVRSVLCRVVGDARCRSVRIYIVRVAEFNASMAPNGMMIVQSGLLLRATNEAELAAVLGHEFGHFELRHSLTGFQRRRTATDIMAWTALLAPNTGGLQNSIAGSIFAFNRAQEKEADMHSFNFLAASPYPSSAAATIWERLMAEQDATAEGRKRKIKHSYSSGFFASHPSELARSTYLREAAGKVADEGDPAIQAYRAGIAKWLPALLDDQIRLNDFGGSEYLLKSLAGDDWTPDLLYARGELYRQRGHPRDLVSAAQFYREAIEKGCSRAEVHRGLGLALLRSGDQPEAARAALLRYISQKPDASDATMIASLIAS